MLNKRITAILYALLCIACYAYPEIALTQAPPEELIQTQTAVCQLYQAATGRGMAAIAMAGVITLGVLAMFQKIFWGQAILYAAAIAGAYGSLSLATHITERTTFAADCDVQATTPPDSPWEDDNTDCTTGPCITVVPGSTTPISVSTDVQDCLDSGPNCSWYPGDPGAGAPAECICNTSGGAACPAGPCPAGSSPSPGDPCICECPPCTPPLSRTYLTVDAGGSGVCGCVGGITCPGSCPPHSVVDPTDPTECDCICDPCPHIAGDGPTLVDPVVSKVSGVTCQCTGCPVPPRSCGPGEIYDGTSCSCVPNPVTCDSSPPVCEEPDGAGGCVFNAALPGCSCTGGCLDGSTSTGLPNCQCDCATACNPTEISTEGIVEEGDSCNCQSKCPNACEYWDAMISSCAYYPPSNCCPGIVTCPSKWSWDITTHTCIDNGSPPC